MKKIFSSSLIFSLALVFSFFKNFPAEGRTSYSLLMDFLYFIWALPAGALEYIDCISAER